MYAIPGLLKQQHSSTMDTQYFVNSGVLFYDIYPHRHDFVEIELIVSGQGIEIVNGIEYPLKKGSLCILLPWHVHEVIINKENPPEIFKCHFALDFLLDENNPCLGLGELILNDKETLPVLDLTQSEYTKIFSLFSELKEEYSDIKVWKDILIQAKIKEIIVYFDRARKTILLNSDRLKKKKQDIWEIIEFIHMSSEQEITLTELSEKFNINKTELNTLLIETTSLQFKELLQEIRIRNSCAYLSYPFINVSEVGYIVGFNSFESFYRAFRRVKGISPGNYRKLFLKNGDQDKQFTSYSFINARIIYYLHLHFDEDLTLTSLAKHFHYNENYLCEMLNQHGSSFTDLLHEIRIYHACTLLSSTDLTINDIGFNVGFNSIETFYRVFKRLKGLSPGEYRKKENYRDKHSVSEARVFVST